MRCRRGAVTTEFGLILLPFCIFLAGFVEIAYQATTAGVLDAATLRASRFGVTGQQRRPNTPSEVTCRSETIPWVISNSSAGFLKSNRITVTTQTFGGLNGFGGTPVAGAGLGDQVVVYTVTYRQPFLTIGWYGGGATSLVHQSVVVVKNEPFTNATC